MISMKNHFEKLIHHVDLSRSEITDIMTSMMQGQLEDAQIAAFLALMRSKGHAEQELSTAADIMRQYSINLQLNKPAIDIVGTGGDGMNTFNISTVSSFVIAAAGIPVAKHGNISVSSNSGSANFLQQVGIKLDADNNLLAHMFHQANLCFLFAPNFHPALKYAAPARKALGIRTFFNLLGPLLNPAQVKRQIVGVFDQAWHPTLSGVLEHLGSERHCIVTAEDGMDEVSLASPTRVTEYHQQTRKEWILNPIDFGLQHHSLESIMVNSAAESAAIGLSVLDNTAGAAKDIVLLNAALAIYLGHDDLSYDEALTMADQAIASGKAKTCLETLIQLSNQQD